MVGKKHALFKHLEIMQEVIHGKHSFLTLGLLKDLDIFLLCNRTQAGLL